MSRPPFHYLARMDEVAAEIERALAAGLYLAATLCALAVPDMCGALPAPNGQATGPRYARWFDNNMGPLGYTGWLSGQDCYRLRCSLLHQGSAGHPRSVVGRVVLVEPMATGNVVHRASVTAPDGSAALVLDVRTCSDMASAALGWWASAQADATVQRNHQRFARRMPLGLPPFIVGTSVIA